MAKAKSSSSRANSSRTGNTESRNSIILLFTVATGKKKIAEEMQFLLQIQMQRAGGQKGEQNQDQEITMLYCLKESEMKSLHLTSVVKYQRQHMGNVLSLTWAHYLDTISSLPCPKFPSFSSGSGQSTFSLSFVRSAISPSVLSQTDYLDFCSFESKITAFSYYP